MEWYQALTVSLPNCIPKKRETIWQLLKANLSKKTRRMKPLRHKSKRFKEVVSPSFFVTFK
jgi:hypothetical protein